MNSLKQKLEQEESQIYRAQNSGNISFSESQTTEDRDEETSRTALAVFRAREEEIEKKKFEMKEKVHAHLGRVESEIKRLSGIRHELEALADPKRKEVTILRKKIDTINRELKPLEKSCQKKEKEYKETLDAVNEKNKEKTQLLAKLMELVSESERARMKKLEELGKHIDSLMDHC